jgi:hypothetical protein
MYMYVRKPLRLGALYRKAGLVLSRSPPQILQYVVHGTPLILDGGDWQHTWLPYSYVRTVVLYGDTYQQVR